MNLLDRLAGAKDSEISTDLQRLRDRIEDIKTIHSAARRMGAVPPPAPIFTDKEEKAWVLIKDEGVICFDGIEVLSKAAKQIVFKVLPSFKPLPSVKKPSKRKGKGEPFVPPPKEGEPAFISPPQGRRAGIHSPTQGRRADIHSPPPRKESRHSFPPPKKSRHCSPQ